MVTRFAIIFAITSLFSMSWAAGQPAPTDPRAEGSYSLGYEFGQDLRKQQIDVDPEVLLSAVREGLEGKTPSLGVEQMQEILEQLRRKVAILQQRRMGERAEKSQEAGKAFLEANRTREGVRLLPSGLQYRVLREGSGPSPKASDAVTVNYRGSLVDGTEFDSSYLRGQPAHVSVSTAIRGWAEALQLMRPGAKWELAIPPELAYGSRPFGRIPPNSTLLFEIELLSIVDGEGPKAPTP